MKDIVYNVYCESEDKHKFEYKVKANSIKQAIQKTLEHLENKGWNYGYKWKRVSSTW